MVRSLRDISIVYSVGEMLSNTVEHFDECAKLSGSGSEVSGDPSGPAPSQPGLGLPGTGNGFGAMDVGREDEEVVGDADVPTGSDEKVAVSSAMGLVNFQPEIPLEERV